MISSGLRSLRVGYAHVTSEASLASDRRDVPSLIGSRCLRRLIDNVLSGGGALDGEVVEEFLHVDADLFVAAVDGGPAGGLRPWRGLRSRRGSGR